MSDDAFDDLVLGYFDGTLSDEQFAVLSSMLASSCDRRQRFLEQANINVGLRETSQWEADEAFDLMMLADHGDAELRVYEPAPRSDSRPKRGARRRLPQAPSTNDAGLVLSLGGVQVYRGGSGLRLKHLAAAALALAGGVLLALILLDGGVDEPAPSVLAQDTPPAPAPVLTAATAGWQIDARWTVAGEPTEVAPGQALEPGRYELRSGFAALTLASGVDVLLEGPCSVELSADNLIGLSAGALTADVPEHAIGFVVQADAMRVTDLGTRFGVRVGTDGTTQTAVFSGAVQMEEPAEIGGVLASDRSVVVVREGWSRSANAAGQIGPVAEPIAGSAGFTRDWRDAAYQPGSIAGPVDYLDAMPPNLDLDVFDSDRAAVMLERSAVAAPETIADVLAYPGIYAGFDLERPSGRLEAGTVVDSYLVHFDPPEDWDDRAVTFTIRMPRPIVAVLPQLEQLTASQRWAGALETRYPNPDRLRGRGGIGLEYVSGLRAIDYEFDVITISEDRRTITAKLYAGPSMDQFRVLIEPADQPVDQPDEPGPDA